MTKKRKMTHKDFEPLPDPVWGDDGRPTAFFLDWWQRVAELRYGDKGKWVDAAREFGYIGTCYYESATNRSEEGPIGFGYDPKLYRESLGLPMYMPLVSSKGSPDEYHGLWNHLLREGANG